MQEAAVLMLNTEPRTQNVGGQTWSIDSWDGLAYASRR